MNKITNAAISAMLLIGITACKSTKTTPAALIDLNGEWDIIQVDGTNIAVTADQEMPFITFDTDNGQVSGSVSCNRIMGTFDTKALPGKIDLSHTVCTRMMCPNMMLENKILGALSQVNAYRYGNDSTMELLHDKNLLIVLQQRKPVVNISLTGTWKITKIHDVQIPEENGQTYQLIFNDTDNSFNCITGCNSINGTYDIDETTLTCSNIIRTNMMCANMAIEDSLCSILPRIASFSMISDSETELYDSDNHILLTMSAK
jgi:heat shock protein HslJ